MSKWLVAALLLLQAHFAASYLVPLDDASQQEFGGLMRWAWPWSIGDGGPLGQMTASGFPLAGFFLAATAAVASLLALLAVIGLWVPFAWWRGLTIAGAALSFLLMVGFFGPTKLLPMALSLVILWVALTDRLPATAD